MSLFNFFGKKKPVTLQQHTSAVKDENLIPIDKKLFVDEESPSPNRTEKTAVNPLQEFLNQNFEGQGFDDGYYHPELDFLNSKLAMLRSTFRLAIDKCIEFRRIEISDIRLHLIDINGISPKLEAKLKEKQQQIESVIHELDTQKILSIENEGIISSATNSYRLGFIKGLELYQKEKIFTGNNVLFN